MAPAGLKGRLGKIADVSKKEHPIIIEALKKNRHPKLKRFFLLQTTYLHESLEGLNSSLAQSDGELLPGEKYPPEWFLREQDLGQFLVYEP